MLACMDLKVLTRIEFRKIIILNGKDNFGKTLSKRRTLKDTKILSTYFCKTIDLNGKDMNGKTLKLN